MILLFSNSSDTLILCVDASSFHCLIVCTFGGCRRVKLGVVVLN